MEFTAFKDNMAEIGMKSTNLMTCVLCAAISTSESYLATSELFPSSSTTKYLKKKKTLFKI